MREDTRRLVDEFLGFMRRELGVSELPEIEFVGRDFSDRERSFGQWDGDRIKVVLGGRHPMDVLRTLAHEIVHQVRGHTDGRDGSADENEANAMAGKFMRKFGKARSDGFGLIPEGRRRLDEYGENGSIQSFFGTSPNRPEGFEVANDGVVRRAPGEGPGQNSTADGQEMMNTDRDQGVQPVELDVVPDGVSRSDIEQILRPLRDDPEMRPVYDSIVGAGAYDRVQLKPDQAERLSAVVGDFLDTRSYNRPKKVFAQDIMDQLGGKLEESYSGDGESEEGFERQDMARHAPELAERLAGIRAPPSGPSVMGVIRELSADLRRSSEREHEEHPWTTKGQAERIALDHEREGKTS